MKSKCVDVILKNHDRFVMKFENELSFEYFSPFPGNFDINDFIGTEYEFYMFNDRPQVDIERSMFVKCVMSSDKNIYLIHDDGDFSIYELNMFNDWLSDERKDIILNYFNVSSLKDISKDDLLNFIKTIDTRCEFCGEILNDDDWDNWSGTYWQPPECNGYHCSHCGETVKF